MPHVATGRGALVAASATPRSRGAHQPGATAFLQELGSPLRAFPSSDSPAGQHDEPDLWADMLPWEGPPPAEWNDDDLIDRIRHVDESPQQDTPGSQGTETNISFCAIQGPGRCKVKRIGFNCHSASDKIGACIQLSL